MNRPLKGALIVALLGAYYAAGTYNAHLRTERETHEVIRARHELRDASQCDDLQGMPRLDCEAQWYDERIPFEARDPGSLIRVHTALLQTVESEIEEHPIQAPAIKLEFFRRASAMAVRSARAPLLAWYPIQKLMETPVRLDYLRKFSEAARSELSQIRGHFPAAAAEVTELERNLAELEKGLPPN